MITADGSEFLVYLEGVRIPALSITLSYGALGGRAAISVYPHDSAKEIKEGTLVAIFHKKAGVNKSSLIYFGYLTSRAYNKIDGQHTFVLNFSSRSNYLRKINIASQGDSTITNALSSVYTATTSDPNKTIADREQAQRAAAGTASINFKTARPNPLDNTEGGTKLTHDQAEAGLSEIVSNDAKDIAANNSRTEEKIVNSQVKHDPTGEIWAEVDYKVMIQSFMTRLLKEALNSSGGFNHIIYEDRFLFEKYIQELPGGWVEFFLNGGTISTMSDKERTNAISRFVNTVQQYIKRLGGAGTLEDVLITMMSLLMMEAYEIPGLVHGALQIIPESIYSDIPMCNILWPEQITEISYNEDYDRKITRLMFTGALLSDKEGISIAQNKPTTSTYAAGMYPDAFKVIKELIGTQTLEKSYNGITFETEAYCGSMVYKSDFPARFLQSKSPDVLGALAEYSYNNVATNHRGCTVTMFFNPKLVPGMRAVVNDGLCNGVGKIVQINHSIYSGQQPMTSISMTNYEYTDEYKYVIPSWYSKDYEPTNVSGLYETIYGCKSIGAYLNKPGTDMQTLVNELNDIRKNATMKGHIADKLTERYSMSQEEFFNLFNCTVSQQDSTGPLIYQGKVFDEVVYFGYTIDGAETEIKADRQKPIVDYLKTIYGKYAVKV